MIFKIIILGLSAIAIYSCGLFIGRMDKTEEKDALLAEKNDAITKLNALKTESAGLQLQNMILMDQVRELTEWRTEPPTATRIASFPAIIVDNSGKVHSAYWNGLNWVCEYHKISRGEVRCWRPLPEPPAK